MAGLEVKRFDSPDETRAFQGKGQMEVVEVASQTIGRGTFEPGWRWSENVKPIAGTDSCQVSHLGYIVSGRMRIFMDDGSEGELGPGDVVAIAPGHDAEIVGDEACVMLDFGEFGEYAKRD
jgi:quercetin dioxygenase-like cupin family protein